jgi:hypothetical protein
MMYDITHHTVPPGSVWFHDIVPPCLATSCLPQVRGVGDVACEAGGHCGQDRGTDESGGVSRLRGLCPVGLRAVPPLRCPGEVGLEPRSRRPRASPGRTSEALEDEIVLLRKEFMDQGLDAGAHTIAVHLSRRHGRSPAPATIWRILSAGASSPPSRRSARSPRSSGSVRRCPTSVGRPTSPIGSSQTTPTSRS